MKQSVLNLLFLILWIVIWVLNPWPFEKSLNSSKTDSIEKVIRIQGGFDPLQRNAKKANLQGLNNDPSQQQAAKQSSSSNSNTDPKLKYRSTPGSNPGGSGNYGSDENFSNSGNSDQVISDPEFWDSIESLGESDEEEASTPTEAPKPSPPTKELTKKGVR